MGIGTRSRRQHREVDYTLGMCYRCNGVQDFSIDGKNQFMLKCVDCHRNVHPSCSGLNQASAEIVKTYKWQCNDCKSCLVCKSKNDEDKLVFCSHCDRGHHIFCCTPSLKSVPKDDWYCSHCTNMPSPSSLPSPPTSSDIQDFTTTTTTTTTHKVNTLTPPPNDHPLSPSLSDSNNGYRLRRSPTHSIKYIENATPTMTRNRKKKDEMKQITTIIETTISKKSNKKPSGRKALEEQVAIPEETSHKRRKRRKHVLQEEVVVIKKRKRRNEVEEEPPIKLRLTVHEETPKKPEYNEDFFKTFGNKLTMAEADTKKGTPSELDRANFEKAKSIVEKMKLNKPLASATNQQKEDSEEEEEEEDESNDSKWKPPKIEMPKINTIRFGDYLIDTWYAAPYPEEYSQSSTLYICEFCMKYMKSDYVAGRHRKKCAIKHPPGDEIYRDGKISIFEVDGRKNKIYCQHLCLMAKMFLDHKTLYYDVEPFLFYIMTEADDRGCHFVGYFSKEKCSAMSYNVSCILTMPIYQRKGYGQFLIDFSYLLSKKENKAGTPERPLSDLGLLSYRSYWKSVLFRALIDQQSPISIEEMSVQTSLMPDDIISTLQISNMIRFDDEAKHYVFTPNVELIKSYLDELDKKAYIRVKPKKLTWTPFVLSRDRLAVMMGQAKLTIKNGDETSDVDIT